LPWLNMTSAAASSLAASLQQGQRASKDQLVAAGCSDGAAGGSLNGCSTAELGPRRPQHCSGPGKDQHPRLKDQHPGQNRPAASRAAAHLQIERPVEPVGSLV
jgi:hypothetical protein